MKHAPSPLFDNAAWPSAAPAISVLIPFLRDDPTPLIAALDREAASLGGQVEVVLFDDGTGDGGLTTRLKAALADLGTPARLESSPVNLGRAQGRNRLAAHARGGWLLFLDSDMLPDRPDFLSAYLALIERDRPAVVFGGFSLEQTPEKPEHALHRRMALASDCAPLAVRRRTPEKYVYTSNLLVRRDVFEAVAFDAAFAGWGWEDVEWAMRVRREHAIMHIDNPATHLGLDAAPAIAAKYEQSAANFARVVAAHLETVRRYPSYKVARMLKPLPARGVWRPRLKSLALAETAPLAVRALAMRLYRAALYVDAV
jgi:glycosyltransferase involved in cell wall biosynthesis